MFNTLDDDDDAYLKAFCNSNALKQKSLNALSRSKFNSNLFRTLLIATLLATTDTVKALRSALGCWLTWTCQFKLLFIVLSADNNIRVQYHLGYVTQY